MIIQDTKIKHQEVRRDTLYPRIRYVNLIIAIVGILGVCLGFCIIIRKGIETKNELIDYQSLQIFLRVDDLAHEWIINSRKRWNIYSWSTEEFYKIDDAFHSSAKTLDEKHKYAEEMDQLLNKMDTYIHQIGWLITPEEQARDRKYHEIDNIFQQLQQAKTDHK